MRYQTENWRPAESREVYTTEPPVGALIALERQAWRVIRTELVPLDEWTDDDEAAYQIALRCGSNALREDWKDRPRRLHVRAAGSNRSYTADFRNARYWHVIPDHHPVCVRCGELYPCRHIDAARDADQAGKHLDKLAARLPGCCWGCNEPITSRQKTIVFPGANAELPGGPDVRFHQRNSCWGRALSYEKLWLAADPLNLRFLSCPGGQRTHANGTSECTEGAACPGFHAVHMRHWACYIAPLHEVHGPGDLMARGTGEARCERGCLRGQGHPGARPLRKYAPAVLAPRGWELT